MSGHTDDTDGDDENVAGGLLQRIVPNVIRRNYALKFAIVLLVMGLLIVGVGFAGTGFLSEEVENNVEAEYERLASQQATIVEKWIEREATSTRLLAQDQALGMSVENQSQQQTLNNALGEPTRQFGNLRQLHVVTRSNENFEFVGSHVYVQPNGMDVAGTEQAWITEANISMNIGEVVASDVYTVSGTPVIGFITPVRSQLNRYLVAEFSVSELVDSLRTTTNNASTEQFTQVVNDDAIVQADSRLAGDADSATLLEEYGNRDTLQRARALADGGTTAGMDVTTDSAVMDEEYAVGYATIQTENVETDWVVLTHTPTSEVFGFVRTITQWGQIATLGSVVLIVVVGAVMGYSTTSSINRLRRKAEAMEDGDLEVSIRTTRIDAIGQLYGAFANMRDALREQINEAEQARKEAEVSRAEAMEMNEYLQEKAEEYSETMEQCGAGDLTQRMAIDGENEAMDRIATEFNEMIDELEKTTGQLKSFADEVETAGEVVKDSSESVQEAAEQVADSVQHISDDAYEQQERLQEVSEEIDTISARLDEFAAEHPDIDFETQLSQIDEVATTIATVVDLSEETLEEAESVAGAAEEQAAELNEVSQRADDLIRYAGPLHDVLDRFETESEHEFYFPTGPREGGDPTEE